MKASEHWYWWIKVTKKDPIPRLKWHYMSKRKAKLMQVGDEKKDHSLIKCQEKEGNYRKTLRTKSTPCLMRLEKTSSPAED